MTVITKEFLAALNTNINVTWQDRYKNATNADLWKQIAMPVNSKHSSEQYAWLGSIPGLREFKSERIPGTLSNFSYTINNKKWESTLDVDRDALEDDMTGQIMIAVNTLATKAGKAYTTLVTKAFDAGFTTLAFDGNNFFDTAHATGSNSLGAARDINQANVLAAELLLNQQADDAGDYLGYAGTHIIVGPSNAAAAKALVNSRTVVSGGAAVDNPLFEQYKVIVLPGLGTSKNWALADLSEGLLPFILQIRVAITLIAKTDLNSDRAFDKDIFTWGTRARHNVGLGNHQLIVGATSN